MTKVYAVYDYDSNEIIEGKVYSTIEKAETAFLNLGFVKSDTIVGLCEDFEDESILEKVEAVKTLDELVAVYNSYYRKDKTKDRFIGDFDCEILILELE